LLTLWYVSRDMMMPIVPWITAIIVLQNREGKGEGREG
jgi:hypothetical protein